MFDFWELRTPLRYLLTKRFFLIFGIISGFIAVGITCRLRISGLGPVSCWYHDTNLWYLFWPCPKKGISWYQLISSRITWHTSINIIWHLSVAKCKVPLLRQIFRRLHRHQQKWRWQQQARHWAGGLSTSGEEVVPLGEEDKDHVSNYADARNRTTSSSSTKARHKDDQALLSSKKRMATSPAVLPVVSLLLKMMLTTTKVDPPWQRRIGTSRRKRKALHQM